MKTILISGILISSSSVAFSQVFDPLGKHTQNVRPKNLTLISEQIEVDTTEVVNLLFGDNINKPGKTLRKEVEILIKNKKGKFLRKTSASTQLGIEIKQQSTKPTFFPTEFTSPEVKNGNITPITPKAIEERPIGSILKAQATLLESNNTPYFINLSMNQGVSKKHGDLVWFTMKVKGTEHKITMPVYSQFTQKQQITLRDGKTELSSVIPARNADGTPNPSSKVLTFLTCSITILP